jgi:hypothetical protein
MTVSDELKSKGLLNTTLPRLRAGTVYFLPVLEGDAPRKVARRASEVTISSFEYLKDDAFLLVYGAIFDLKHNQLPTNTS